MLTPDHWSTVYVFVALGLACIAGMARIGWRRWSLLLGVPTLVIPLFAGAAAVNVSYGYYQSWNDVYRDLMGRPIATNTPASVADGSDKPSPSTAHKGRLMNVELKGQKSGITRPAVVWLPGAYDDPANKDQKFPVVVLMHGDPGEPKGFIYGMHVDEVSDQLTLSGQMKPAVIVMPTVWAGWHEQQCLDAVNGPKNETYLAEDVPGDIQQQFRVEQPGRNWVLAGLSEGGFCAANLALRHPTLFAGAASLDGYYSPIVAGSLQTRLFGGDKKLQDQATPLLLARSWPQPPAPSMWIMSGDQDASDLRQARDFATEAGRVATVRRVVVTGGKHTTPSWRTALPDLLEWTTNLASGNPAASGSITLKLQN